MKRITCLKSKLAMRRTLSSLCAAGVLAGILSGTALISAEPNEPVDGWERVGGEAITSRSTPSLSVSEGSLQINNSDSKWVQYGNVNLHENTDQLQLRVASDSDDAAVQLLLGDSGTPITLNIGNTGGLDTYVTKTFDLGNKYAGTQDVKFVFSKGSVSIDWLKFRDSTQVPEMPDVSVSYEKPRVININDMIADKDDEQSLVRMLVMSNMVDLEGIIVGTSCWRPNQDIGETRGMDKTMEIIEAYGKVLDNLNKHAKGYPTLEELKEITVYGQQRYSMGDVGEGKTSEGAQLIIDAVFKKDDERPVWVNCWGGTNTVAQAIWVVANSGEYSEEELDYFISKLRVFDILGQDDAGAWMTKNYPDLIYIRSCAVYGTGLADGKFYDENVQNHGPLGAVYPDPAWTYEGDTPAFLYQIPTGMNDPEHLDWGSWGGRFSLEKKANVAPMSGVKDEAQYKPFYMYTDADGSSAISRWSTAIQNDFAARMDWTMTDDYSAANHHPIAVINGDETLEILEETVQAGETFALSAEGSSDPDGDSLSYSWSVYKEPSTYKNNVTITNSTSEEASITIPADAAGKEIHLILEIHDDGDPSLYAYRRIVFTVE